MRPIFTVWQRNLLPALKNNVFLTNKVMTQARNYD
jgi:hypothetical protein